jgi:excisionase family DNA binding protein
MNAPEAAAFVNLAITTLYKKKAKRIIPHYKPGKKLLFKKAELLVWIQSYKESIGPRTKTRST